MILVCEVCSTSLQIDEKKVPTGKFSIRCPKCQNTVRVNIGDADNSQNNLPKPVENKSWEAPPQAAKPYKPAQTTAESSQTSGAPSSNDGFLNLLANLLRQNGDGAAGGDKFADSKRRILICLPPEQSELTARILSEAGWEVYVAETPSQAIETLGDMRMENVVFAQNFAINQQGAFALIKYFNQLTAAERRRVLLVSVENTLSTFNAQEAFLRNLNLIVNVKDLSNLPIVLRRARRDFDDVYRNFKMALNAA